MNITKLRTSKQMLRAENVVTLIIQTARLSKHQSFLKYLQFTFIEQLQMLTANVLVGCLVALGES